MPASLAVCPLLALALLAGGAFFLVRHETAHERRPRGAPPAQPYESLS